MPALQLPCFVTIDRHFKAVLPTNSLLNIDLPPRACLAHTSQCLAACRQVADGASAGELLPGRQNAEQGRSREEPNTQNSGA
eukprot:6207804-Pleurochrysis_carterae.AAC.3